MKKKAVSDTNSRRELVSDTDFGLRCQWDAARQVTRDRLPR